MKLEEQVTSLELSKRLKELGVKQESFFNWNNGKLESDHVMKNYNGYENCIAAFTVAELGELLPQGCVTFLRGHVHKWRCLPGRILHGIVPEIDDLFEAEARGLMVEYLITNNLMSV